MAAIALSAELAKAFDKLETLVELGETYIKAPPALDGPDLTESGGVKPHELDASTPHNSRRLLQAWLAINTLPFPRLFSPN